MYMALCLYVSVVVLAGQAPVSCPSMYYAYLRVPFTTAFVYYAFVMTTAEC